MGGAERKKGMNYRPRKCAEHERRARTGVKTGRDEIVDAIKWIIIACEEAIFSRGDRRRPQTRDDKATQNGCRGKKITIC